MTKEEFRKRYKHIDVKRYQDGIVSVDLYTSEKKYRDYYVNLLFANGMLIYSGDMGYYIFEKNITDPKTFFKGEAILPEYWAEKIECSSYPVMDEINPRQVKENFLAYIKEGIEDGTLGKEPDEEELDWITSRLDELDGNETRMIDVLDDLVSEYLDDILDTEDLADFVNRGREYHPNYLYACELIQWVENEILKEENKDGTVL